MGRASTKDLKNEYQRAREECLLTREHASELLEFIQPERIVRIENETMLPRPEEVVKMAEIYKCPELKNYYCTNQCKIGAECLPKIKVKDLSIIVLEMLSSLNTMNKQKDRLIDISADGKIDDEEIDDFVKIQKELAHISITVDTLSLWAEKMIASGQIDKEKYLKRLNELKSESKN